MSFRFNPISLLSRRSSKAKNKGRSESADQTSLRSVDDVNEEYVRKPRIIHRPSKPANSEQSQSTTLRAQVLASLRRARSPRRRKHQKEEQTGRATSVPPAPVIPTNVTSAVTAEVKSIVESATAVQITETQPPSSKTTERTSPAPLAKHDSYESTDTVYFNTNNTVEQASTSASGVSYPSYENRYLEEECTTPKVSRAHPTEDITKTVYQQEYFAQPQADTFHTQFTPDAQDDELQSEGMESSEFCDDSDDETTEIEVNFAGDDQSVSKLSVEYETEYPVLNHSDSISSMHSTPKHERVGNFYFAQDEDATPRPSDSEMSSSTPVSFRSEDEDDDLMPSDEEPQDYAMDTAVYDESTDQTRVWQPEDATNSGYINEPENDTADIEEPEVDPLAPKFEVQFDPQQDPFQAVESAAMGTQEWNEQYLTTPSIIVTSASSDSLRKIDTKDAYEPPTRPPPPSPGSTPKRPPVPPSAPPVPPPRPDHTPTPAQPESKKKRKKDKLFGIVDLGPLPSDPDPNFPFRRHFEKSILPNPKKAFQRIVRGETKAERRQRKEQAELNRLLKGADTKPVKSDQPPVHSKEWEEFQALKARIQSTVQESASKIQALASVIDDEKDSKPDTQATDSENWADFDSAFCQSDQKPSEVQQPEVETFQDKLIEVTEAEPVQTFEPDWDQAFAKTDISPELPETEQEWNNLAQSGKSILDSDGIRLEDFVPDWNTVDNSDSQHNWASQAAVEENFPSKLLLETNSVDSWDNIFTGDHIEDSYTASSTTKLDSSPIENTIVIDPKPEIQREAEEPDTPSSNLSADWATVFQTNNPNPPNSLNQTDQILNQQTVQSEDWNSLVQQQPQIVPKDPGTSDFVDNWDSVFPANKSLLATSQPEVSQKEDLNFLAQPSESKHDTSTEPENSNLIDNWQTVFNSPDKPSIPDSETQLEQIDTLIKDNQISQSTPHPSELNFAFDQSTPEQDFRLGGDRGSLSPVKYTNQNEIAAPNLLANLINQAPTNEWDSYFVNTNLTYPLHQVDNSEQFKHQPPVGKIEEFPGISKETTFQLNKHLISDLIDLPEPYKSDLLTESDIRPITPVAMDGQTELDKSITHGLDMVQREGYQYGDDNDNEVVGQVGNETSSSSGDNSSMELNAPNEENVTSEQVVELSGSKEQSDLEAYYQPDKPVNSVQDTTLEIDNPFAGDSFGTPVSQSGTSSSIKYNTEEIKSMARPRAKPVRQETLSGNNPFRRKTSEEQTGSGDELAAAAAGIELHPVKKVGVRLKDSFESDESDEGHTVIGSGLTSMADLQNDPDKSGFDPLQTIYPESENDDSGSDRGDHTIHVTIKKEEDNELKSDKCEPTKVPLIQAPPPRPIISTVESQLKPEQNGTDEQEFSDTVPEGWVTFAEDTFEATNEATPDVDIIERAFEVTWDTKQASLSRRESELEPVRPDTPDPELDIPFHPPADTHGQWRLWLRYPEKKTRVKQVSKYTTDRYWREIMVTFNEEHGRKVICLHEVNEQTSEASPTPYRTIRIEPYMQLSREKLQQYDKYGKVHVFKLNHVSYKELVGIRPEKFSIKNLQHLVTHKPKQNVAVDHLPIYTEVLKFGSLDQNRIRTLMPVFEDALMAIPSHKDTSLNYNKEEVCCYVIDEYLGKLSSSGTILEQKARTRIFCTAFVNGGPHIVLGLNDKWRYGREVVRRSDILPVMHDEWISIRNPEFHSCVQMDEYEKDHMLKFFPLDGCRFELLRFRVSLRSNRELPMQVRTTYSIDGRRVSMRCDLLVPGFFSASKRSGAVPCEDVEIHIPVPEEWIYHFRVEKHNKYGSVHSTLRKPGKIKGLERITQMAQSLLPPSILEASIGLAKYEHLYKAIVWRISRVPDKSEASFRPHLLSCNLILAPHDNVPEWDTLVPDCQIEYTMPSSTVSGATVRSISVESSEVVEKFVKYTTKYKYSVEIDYQLGARKEPALKSLFDDSSEPVNVDSIQTSEILDKYDVIDDSDLNNETTGAEVVENNSEQTKGHGEVVDLLGLGDEFFPSTANSANNSNQSDSQIPVETTQDLL